MFNDFHRITLRSLVKNKGYSSLNIFGLSIGIACAGLIFLWVESEMTYDSIHEKKDHLYIVHINTAQGDEVHTMASTPRIMSSTLKNTIPGIKNVARISDEKQRLLFTIGDRSLYASGRYADASLFSMFTLPFVQGSPLKAFAQLQTIVITEKTAKNFFGTEGDILGKSVRINNKQDYIISGVIKDLPENATLQFDWLLPFENDPYYNQSQSWDSYGPLTYVELNEKVDLKIVAKQLKDFIHQRDPSQHNETFLFPMNLQHLYYEFENGKPTGGGQIKQVNKLIVIGWIILAIACINFVNLATANGQKRAKEVGIRKTLGASRKKLVVQFLGEALLMSFIATLFAILFMIIALPLFNILMQRHLNLNLTNSLHLVALLSITLVCGLLAGTYPALYLSDFKPVRVLKGLKVRADNILLRKGLVIFQFAIAIIFIISTMTVQLQIRHAKQRDLGFDRTNLIEVDMQHSVTSSFDAIKQDLLQTGLVEDVAISDHPLLNGGNTDGRFRWEGRPDNANINIAFRDVSPEFISTAGMKIIEGRDFHAKEGNNIIITRSLAQLIGKESQLGNIIASPRGNADGIYTPMTIVGIIDDYIYGNIFNNPQPTLFFCQQFGRSQFLYIRLKPYHHSAETFAKTEAVLKHYNAGYPLEYQFIDTRFAELFQMEAIVGKSSGIFALLAIFISCLGLLGLAIYTVDQRKKEIGIRKVLGANVMGIINLISLDFIKPILISCIIAFPIAWWINKDWLSSYVYRIDLNIWIFAISGALALLSGLTTISVQAIKAARKNPVKSWREDCI